MAPKRSFQIVSIVIAVVIICIGVIVMRLRTHPEQAPSFPEEEITKFKSIDINFPGENTILFFSFSPDGSGVIYVEEIFEGHRPPKPNKYSFRFYYLDFKSGNQEMIHEIDLEEIESVTAEPLIYWLEPNLAFLGGKTYWRGVCESENSNTVALFNLETKEKKPTNCLEKGEIESEILFKNLSQFHSDYSKNKQSYKIFKINYYISHTGTGFVFVSNNYPEYFVSYYLDDVYYSENFPSEQSFIYGEFNAASLSPMKNKGIVIDSNNYEVIDKNIFSRDGNYYFKYSYVSNGCSSLIIFCAETTSKKYLEVYDSNSKMIRKVYIGDVGMSSGYYSPRYISYVDHWSNDNKIVLIENAGGTNHFKVYFIDPVK